jgi:hypothetical protein
MKTVKRSRTPSFKGQDSEMVTPRKKQAMSQQTATNPTKNPGSKGSRVPKGVRRG